MENHGALVGWSHWDNGESILLRLESIKSLDKAQAQDPDMLRLLLTRQQAGLLGQYLVRVSGQAGPAPKSRSRFARLLG